MEVGRAEFAIPVVNISNNGRTPPLDADTQRILTLLSQIQQTLAAIDETLSRLESRVSWLEERA